MKVIINNNKSFKINIKKVLIMDDSSVRNESGSGISIEDENPVALSQVEVKREHIKRLSLLMLRQYQLILIIC